MQISSSNMCLLAWRWNLSAMIVGVWPLVCVHVCSIVRVLFRPFLFHCCSLQQYNSSYIRLARVFACQRKTNWHYRLCVKWFEGEITLKDAAAGMKLVSSLSILLSQSHWCRSSVQSSFAKSQLGSHLAFSFLDPSQQICNWFHYFFLAHFPTLSKWITCSLG